MQKKSVWQSSSRLQPDGQVGVAPSHTVCPGQAGAPSEPAGIGLQVPGLRSHRSHSPSQAV